MKVCVLGATGFIGGHIARKSVAAGWQVRALRRDPRKTGNIPDLDIGWQEGNLADRASLVAAMDGCDVVFHASAYYPTGAGDVARQVRYAVREIRNVLAAARTAGVGRVVYTSSLTTIGPPGEPGRLADERDLYRPGTVAGSAYYEAKYAMEREALQASDSVPVVVLNPSACFGPGDVKPSTGGILIMAARGRALGYIDAVTNFVDVRTVAQAHLAAAQIGQPGARYLVGGRNMTVRAALAVVARVAHVRPPMFRIPNAALAALVAVARWAPQLGLPVNHLQAIPHWQALSCEKANREFGLEHPPFEVTVKDALDWFRAHGRL